MGGKVIGPPTDAGYDGNNNDDGRNNLLMNFDKVQVNMAREDLMTQDEYRQERFTNSKAEKEQKLRSKISIKGKVTEGKWGQVVGPPTDDEDKNNLLMNF